MTEQKYVLKDGRKLTAFYNCHNVSSISKEAFEAIIDELNKSYEQAQQLQTIIENLEKIKADERAKERILTLDEVLQHVVSIERENDSIDCILVKDINKMKEDCIC